MYGYLTPTGSGDPIPLTKTELIIGRHKSCDIVLNFSNVSSKHCKLVLSDGYWFVVDMQSTNGVKVNGVKVSDRRLDPGATLTVSKHDFKLQYDPNKNGASGIVPNEMLHGDEILSTSLMQRAGLEKAKPQNTEEGENGEKKADSRERESATQQKHPPRDFFNDLVFD